MTELRETIAYNKDLTTGMETFLKKYKSTDAPMINTATIELFDAETGEKTYEAKAENVVNNLISKMAYMDYFYSRIKGDISKTAYAGPPFQVIVLTDYAGTEDANAPCMVGNIIGWADKATAYAGTDTTRGTINLTETQLDTAGDGKLHFVFDFPTSAANGTFQTLWWMYTQTGGYVASSDYRSADTTYPNWFVFFNGGFINTSYTVSAGAAINVYDSVTFATKAKISPANMPAIAGSYGPSEYDGTYVWRYDSSANKLHKFSGDMTQWLSSITTSVIAATYYSSCIALEMAELNGTLWIWTDKNFVIPLDKNTGVFGTPIDLKVKTGFAGGNNSGGFCSNGVDTFYIHFSNVLFFFDANWNFLGKSTLYGGNSSFNKFKYDRINKRYAAQSGTYSPYGFYIFNIYPPSPGAQNLLAAPVTKTPTSTMKIQYDFQVQKVL